jgi:hypothetical protein
LEVRAEVPQQRETADEPHPSYAICSRGSRRMHEPIHQRYQTVVASAVRSVHAGGSKGRTSRDSDKCRRGGAPIDPSDGPPWCLRCGSRWRWRGLLRRHGLRRLLRHHGLRWLLRQWLLSGQECIWPSGYGVPVDAQRISLFDGTGPDSSRDCGGTHRRDGETTMIRTSLVAIALTALASSAQSMPLAPIQQPESLVTTVRAACGAGYTRVNGVCVRTPARAAARRTVVRR